MTLFALSLTAISATAQVITVTPTVIDFGNMNQMESRDASVRVTNDGAGLLVIREVEADCGCTVPKLAKDQLAPGESTDIDINFNSKKFHGNVMKMVHIYSNDPDTPVVDVVLEAKVFAPVIIDPPTQRVGFDRSLAGESRTGIVTFTATQAPELTLKVGKTRKGLFEVKAINNYEGDPQKAAMEVTIPADMPPGRQRDNARVYTNIEEMPSVDIDLACWVVRQLTLSHEQINFRFKKDLHQKVRLAPFEKGLEFKVTGAEIDLPEIQVEVDNTLPNMEAYVRLDGKPISKDDPRARKAGGRIKGTLKIFTDLANLPVIEVPVTYMIRM